MMDIARIKQLLQNPTGINDIRIHGVDGNPHRLEMRYPVENVKIDAVLEKLKGNKEFYTVEGKVANGLFTGMVTLKYQ